jgi:hypothetical protein
VKETHMRYLTNKKGGLLARRALRLNSGIDTE